MAQVQHLAYVTVQPDWQAVIQDVSSNKVQEETFWISCYCKYHESVHGKVNVTKGKESHSDCIVSGESGVDVQFCNDRTLHVGCTGVDLKKVTVKGYIIQYSPFETGSRIPKPLNCMDMSPNNELYATATESSIKIGDLVNGHVHRELTGHVGEVTTVEFFPSGEVLLSGATDFQLKIWSVLDGTNPVTLKGHTATITSTAIVDRGRNVLSSSRDGTIRLWECGSASTLATIECGSSVNAIEIGVLPDIWKSDDGNLNLDPREVSTKNNIVLAALSDGCLQAFDLGTKKEIFRTQPFDGEATCCAYHAERGIIAVGSSKGIIEIYDIKDIKAPLLRYQRDGNGIQQLGFKLNDNGELTICVATGDGSLFETNPLETMVNSSKAAVEVEYTGYDMDPIYSMRITSRGIAGLRGVVCAGRDGFIRRYE
ncbi:WD40-repeat-containing domain protein [Umbelopsis sp. PMI_123]|nr:WD40-repeat-containing domain protein [Umbelopsis sp. PMI_123]